MYPEDVLTKSRSGRTEVRRLLKKGKFMQYQYLDAETGKIAESGKIKLMLKTGKNIESFYLIPIRGERFLMVKPKEEANKKRKVWNGRKAVDLF